MLNGEGNEHNIKINRSNKQKNKLHVQYTFFLINTKKANLHVQHAFCLCLPLFCATTTLRYYCPVYAFSCLIVIPVPN